MKRRTVGQSALAAWAQDNFPSRPITHLGPFPVGGTTDILAILVQSETQERLKTLDMQPSTMTTIKVSAFQKAQVETWAQVIKVAHMKRA